MSKAATIGLCVGLFATVATVATPPARAADAQAHYAGYVRGVNLFDIDLGLALQPTGYRMQVSFLLTGVLGALYHAHGSTVVEGGFTGPRTQPRSLLSRGYFGGTDHVLQIGWPAGSPKIIQMTPPPEPGREPVADADQAHTIDTLSAIASLIHQVAETGRCEHSSRTFDGERLSEFAARTAGEETLEPTSRSSFQGRALRCDVTGRMIGGFMPDANRAKLSEPKHGTAWFARLQPDQPPVPVRIVFYNRGSPSATLYVQQAPPS